MPEKTLFACIFFGLWRGYSLICIHPSPAEDTAPGARAAAGPSTPQTGCAGRRAACSTWPASPASRARGSCPPGRSSLWWRRRCCAGSTTTACWTTSSGPWRRVSRPARCPRRDSVLALVLNVRPLLITRYPRFVIFWHKKTQYFHLSKKNI